MRIVMLSMSHHTAPLEVREPLSLSGERLPQVLEFLRKRHTRSEVVVLSTCNRTEFYIARPSHESPTIEEMRSSVSEFFNVPLDSLTKAMVGHENDKAVEHLLRVACGIESMVLGEPQILGQVKRAYESAVQHGSVGPALHKVFQTTIATAKHVRNTTGIDQGRLSIGSVAVEFARRIFEKFDDKVVLGIGAGEMAKLTLKHLRDLKPQKLWIANRTLDRAQTLATKLELEQAGIAGGARQLTELDELLVEADIVLTSTGASQPIITAAGFKPLLKRRKYRPIFIIDIAVPRDVEPAVSELNNVYLYNIDDLQKVVDQTREQRSQLIEQCHVMVLEATRQCMAQIQHRDVGVVIKQLRERLHDIGHAEQERTQHKLAAKLSPEQAKWAQEILDEHTSRVVNKILHIPLSKLDHRQAQSPISWYVSALQRLFDLRENTEHEQQETPAQAAQAHKHAPSANEPPRT